MAHIRTRLGNGAVWYTKDDGLVFFGGALSTQHGFGKEPYARLNLFGGSYATTTGAARLNYRTQFRERFGDWDLGVRAAWANPNNVRNFYGLGNETEPESSLDNVRVRMGLLSAEVPFSLVDETGLRFEVAPTVTRTDVGDEQFLDDSLQT